MKPFNITVFALGEEGALGGVKANEYSLVCVRKDLVREFVGVIRGN